MAKAATRPAGGCSVITQPVGSQTKPTISTRAALAIKPARFTSEDLKDPDRLHKVIYDQGQVAANAIHAISSNPLVFGNIIRGKVFTANQTLLIEHRLRRAYQGWLCVRAQGNPWSGVEAALPAAVTSDLAVSLTSVNPGTYDFLVF